MDEAILSEAIHHGFLFRELAVGGVHDRPEQDNSRRDTQTQQSNIIGNNDGMLTVSGSDTVCLASGIKSGGGVFTP